LYWLRYEHRKVIVDLYREHCEQHGGGSREHKLLVEDIGKWERESEYTEAVFQNTVFEKA
jgi:hypothetical protein